MTVTLKSELIHAALATALGIALRNVPLADFDGTFSTLHDGEPEKTEEFFNPSIFEFTMRPELQFAVSGEARAATLTALIESAAATLAGISDQLGGLVTDIRPQPPQYGLRELFGAEDISAALMPIEIDYWSDSSLG